MKTIYLKDIEEVPAKDIRPGHILAEGIVLNTSAYRSTKTKQIIAYYFDTAASGTTVYADALQVVQVYGRVSDDITDAIRETVDGNRPRRNALEVRS